jgi:hypothetical protein
MEPIIGCWRVIQHRHSMATFENVSDDNAILYAAKAYENPQCLTEMEFNEDYKRFDYVKRLCSRYLQTSTMSQRLMLNHLVLLLNVFGVEATVRLVFLRCNEPQMYRVVKPFMLYLNVLPLVVRGICGADIYTENIPLDTKLLEQIRAL